MRYQNRTEAGQQLGQTLAETYGQQSDVIVLGLPRGGVPVAYEVAQTLNAPLDVLIVRKLGVPGHEEMAMGAITADGDRILNRAVIRQLDIGDEAIETVARREQQELQRRQAAYRQTSPSQLTGKTVILVDDGMATGASMMAAVLAVKNQNPTQLVVAVPVASPTTCSYFEPEVDEVVCLASPEPFRAVGAWYVEFPQTSDNEVQDYLAKARQTSNPS